MTPMQKAKARMLLKHVFFATMVISTPLRADKSCLTAATDMREIIYNPDFIDSLDSIELVMFVLAHEVMHIAFKHGLRRNGRNMDLWNIACDHAINLLLKDNGFTIWDKCYCDSRYKGMSAEQIYAKLVEEGQALPQDGLGGDVLEPKNLDSAARAKIEREVSHRVAQAANMARMAGQLTGGLARLVEGMLNPIVPWQDYLRDYMTRITHDDESWSHRNRRFADIYLPARYSQQMGEIVVIGDTSGSVTNEELAKVAAEVSSIADTIRPERIRILWADTKVAGEQVFEVGEPIVLDPQGGGGTDMRVALEHARQFEPQVVILITDGYTPWPAVEPEYPLIVCCSTETTMPVGQVIRI